MDSIFTQIEDHFPDACCVFVSAGGVEAEQPRCVVGWKQERCVVVADVAWTGAGALRMRHFVDFVSGTV